MFEPPSPADPDRMNDPPGADPDPDRTPGLETGGQVPPGETPPAEGSTPWAGPEDSHNPAKGWGKGPLIALGILVAFFVIYFLAWIVLL